MTAIEPHQPAATPAPLDFAALEHQANVLASSSIVPDNYRGKPGDIVAAGMMGHELGFGLMTSLRSIQVIKGKPQLSAEAMLAIVRRAGHSASGETSSTGATARGKRRDTGDEMQFTFDEADAKRARLLGGNGPWTQYPASMYWARAVSGLCRQLFSDVALGSYTLGELSQEPIEVDEWQPSVINADTGDPLEPMADPAQTAAVFDRIEAATPEQQTALLAYMEAHDLVLTEPSPVAVVDAINEWFADNVNRTPADLGADEA